MGLLILLPLGLLLRVLLPTPARLQIDLLCSRLCAPLDLTPTSESIRPAIVRAFSSTSDAASFRRRSDDSCVVCKRPDGWRSASAPRSRPDMAAHRCPMRASMAPKIGCMLADPLTDLVTRCSVSSVFPQPKGPTSTSKPPPSSMQPSAALSASTRCRQERREGRGETPPQAVDRAGQGSGTLMNVRQGLAVPEGPFWLLRACEGGGGGRSAQMCVQSVGIGCSHCTASLLPSSRTKLASQGGGCDTGGVQGVWSSCGASCGWPGRCGCTLREIVVVGVASNWEQRSFFSRSAPPDCNWKA
mmetsp:Transcript_90261/g.264023  ORF Transcript_90261/g.264023 Transcript_90261/m.264023 type:complete len:301 (+) Transcript_90261:478-1380(+)